ncbi:unnamed protein product [Closterium sp. NIES-53]
MPTGKSALPSPMLLKPQRPPCFDPSQRGGRTVQAWLFTMNVFFDANYVSEDTAKIRYTVSLLRGPAMDWWRVIVTKSTDYATLATREGQTGPWASSYFVEVPQYYTWDAWCAAAPTSQAAPHYRAAPPCRAALPFFACIASAATPATAATATMASPTVLTFDAEGRAVDFDVWIDDLQLFLQCDSRDGVSLFAHTSSLSTTPAATADSMVCSQWTTRDAVARVAVRSHLPFAERAHFGEYKTAKSSYNAVVARYSPATAALSRLMLPYLFPDLAAFATVADLINHLRTSDTRYRAALPTESASLRLRRVS